MDVQIEDGLITVPEASVPAIFESTENINVLVEKIRQEVSGHTPDLTTSKGRKAIASLAAKVSKSKVVLDNLGKGLVADIKRQASVVDLVRKTARDQLDELRDKTRKPLTDWEIEQEHLAIAKQAEVEAERDRLEAAAKLVADHCDALQEDELRTLRKQQQAQQDEIDRLNKIESARIEAERVAIEAKEREESKTKELNDRLERDEAERTRREERIRQEAEDKIKREFEAKAEIERNERERIALEKQREQDRADEIAHNRILADEKKARNKRHRDAVNKKAAADIVKAMSDYHSGDITEAKEIAVAIVAAVTSGTIAGMVVEY